MLGDSQPSERKRRVRPSWDEPRKSPLDIRCARIGHEPVSGQGILIERFWAATAKALVYRRNRKVTDIYVLFSIFFVLLTQLAGGARIRCGPLQTEEMRMMKK
jgi:hypothetical protein